VLGRQKCQKQIVESDKVLHCEHITTIHLCDFKSDYDKSQTNLIFIYFYPWEDKRKK
jgi:hypothetical protein